jgi:hypothetical protein
MGGSIVQFGGGFAHISHADVFNQEIEADGKVWRFDYDRRFGPLWLKKNGEPLKNQCPPIAVWDAFDLWLKKYSAAALADSGEERIVESGGSE